MTDSFDGLGEIDPESSVLFLGSGFSLGATNISGNNPPNGRDLRHHFIRQLKMPEDTTYDLQILTEEFAEHDPTKLRDELYRIFRIKSLSASQMTILSKNWRRIYSTNYDDAVEFYRLNLKSPPNSFDVSDQVPSRLIHGAIVHLHGSIRLITPDNTINSLVLGENSYVNQYVVKSPWYNQFERDLAYASGIYIVGYNLGDYHIAGLLMANPIVSARTVFIQGAVHDEIFLRRTKQYGRTIFIGTDGFASALANATRPARLSLDNLRSFRSLDPMRDRRAFAPPTVTEVYDLLVYGNFDPGRLARSQPTEDYAIGRADKVCLAANAIENKAALVVDGRLGNGKSIFLHLLAFELSRRGWKCLLIKPNHSNVSAEIAALNSVEKLVLFIENYSAAQDALTGLREALPRAKLVVEVRTGTYEVRFHELTKLLPKPFDRISLNALSDVEIRSFIRLCQRAGLPIPHKNRLNDLRDMLIDIFDNKSIREKARIALAPLFEKQVTKRILAMTMLVAAHQTTSGAGFIRSVVGEDPFMALKPLQELLNEIFEVSADALRARSPVFSAFVINAFFEPHEIADTVVEVTLAAAKLRADRQYRVLMSNMMAYSSLRQTLSNKGDYTAIIVSIYERLRFDDRISAEPLFWLQYAIAMTETSRLDAADEYIQTAFRKAETLPGFQTFQIDTQAFRIALLSATKEECGRDISNLERIFTGLEKMDAMLAESSHRAFVVRVLGNIEPFVAARRGDLHADQKIGLHFWLLKVAKSLAELPAEFKATTGSEAVRVQIENAAATFLETL